MASRPTTTADNNTLFAIDAELEAEFNAAAEEQAETGAIREETRQRCLDLFAELGKKIDRIASSVRATELKARAASEEATRMIVRQKAAENRVEQVKSMLAFFMRVRGLKRLEGELNTIRLQKNGQASLEVDPLALPAEYNQMTSFARRFTSLLVSSFLMLRLTHARRPESIKVFPGQALVEANVLAFFQRRSLDLFAGLQDLTD